MTEQRLQRLEEKFDKFFKKLDAVIKNQQVTHESLESHKASFQAYCEKMDAVLLEFSEFKVKVSVLQADNIALKAEIKALRASIEDGYYTSHCGQVEVVGIPPTPMENVKNVVLKIAAKLGDVVTEPMVKSAVRLQGRQGKQGNILVSFVDSATGLAFLDKARKSRLKAEDIGFVGGKNQLYFNELLSLYSKQLLFRSREFSKSEGWKYCWVRGGKIYLRKADKQPAIRVTCDDDLLVLKRGS